MTPPRCPPPPRGGAGDIGYYPGCSLAGGAVELDLSIRALARVAGAELREIDDWNCCGATAAHSLNHDLAVALPFRALALAEAQGLGTVLAPCAACFSRLKGTLVRLGRDPGLAERAARLAGLPFQGKVRVVSINGFINGLLADGLAGTLTRPLPGLKAVPYYGCLLSRGEGINEGEDPESPSAMEGAIKAAGCSVLPWNFATECCGGGFSMSKTEAVMDLGGAVLSDAKAAGADLVVVGCPMCHSNLDMRRRGAMPVLYLSELLGLAAGLSPAALGLDRHFTDARTVCAGGRP
ncbi:MAG: CoB--CoM heterodisulfide reductase iron-sulfur subunit B family protein [Elusimicrobia bacterium]|nr:CoB--CoM heterodisulfide reductase iron-sulfur subunit B family protein [Elusimicrobiota bacterium]